MAWMVRWIWIWLFYEFRPYDAAAYDARLAVVDEQVVRTVSA